MAENPTSVPCPLKSGIKSFKIWCRSVTTEVATFCSDKKKKNHSLEICLQNIIMLIPKKNAKVEKEHNSH